MNHIYKWGVIVFISALTAFGISYGALHNPLLGATILTTASSDTLTTFRTNVNTSLTNLNNAVVGIVSTSSPIAASEVLYATGVNTMASVATSTPTLGAEFSYSGTFGKIIGGSSGTLSLATNGIAFSKLAQVAANTVLGNNTGATGNLTAFATSTLGIAISDTTGVLAIARGGTNSSGSTYGGTNQILAYNGTAFASYNGYTLTSSLLSATNLAATYASTTQITAASQTFYIDSTGKITGKDTARSDSGTISPLRSPVVQTATSTVTFTSTSTPGFDATIPFVFTFAGTLKRALCTSNTFLGVNIKINSTSLTPSYWVSSSTVGTITFTGNNTFAVGDVLTAYFGTTTSATVASGVPYASCSLDLVQS